MKTNIVITYGTETVPGVPRGGVMGGGRAQRGSTCK